jgi:hypothetical protein
MTRIYKKKNALFPAEREKPCDHALGFPFSGNIPCTGARLCPMCGARREDVLRDELVSLQVSILAGHGTEEMVSRVRELKAELRG